MYKLKKDLKKGEVVSDELAKLMPELVEKIEENKKWRAEEGERYFMISDMGDIDFVPDDRDEIDDYRYSIGNYFQTLEDAEKYKEKLIVTQKLKDLALRLNNGVKIDWEDCRQAKYYIYFDHDSRYLNISCTGDMQDLRNIYCLSEDFLKIALKEIGEDKLKLLFED